MPELAPTIHHHADLLRRRTQEIYAMRLDRIHRRTDHVFAQLMIFQWLAGILIALWVSPFAWSGADSSIHVHVWAALFLGAAITSLPVALIIYHPGKPFTRHTVAVGQMLSSALLIHLTGGRIETHFHVFGSLALLAFYRDWKVLLTATIVVSLDHFIRGSFWPQSVYGVLAAAPLRTLEHAGWVLFEDYFLFNSVQESIKDIYTYAEREAALEATNAGIEQTVIERTEELSREIADRKHAQKVLAEQEARLRTVLHATADGILSIDEEGIVRSFNAAAERIFDYPADEVLGHNFQLFVPEMDPSKFDALLSAQASGNGHSAPCFIESETQGRRRDGSSLPLMFKLTETRYAGQLFFIALVQDITERKKAAEELSNVHRQLLETSRQAGMAEVAAGVLHNVGNALTSINITANLLDERLKNSKVSGLKLVRSMLQEHEGALGQFIDNDPRGRQLPTYLVKLADHIETERADLLKELHTLDKSVEHIKRILSLQQSYARGGEHTEQLDLADLIEDAIGMVAVGLSRAGIQLRRDFASIPRVMADRHKLLQILLNLLSNARQALDEGNPPGERRLTIRVRASQDEESVALLQVCDNGVGITQENRERIFEYGFTTRKDGHGFGLHSSALAAKAMGGALHAESEGFGKGTTFTLKLPLVVREVEYAG